MCGIAGVIGELDANILHEMISSLAHRGPDGSGIYSNGICHIGSTRLSIIDLEATSKPLISSDGKTAIVFNGEIYNHGNLRNQLKDRGYLFNSRTDTEVVLYAYREYGKDFVSHFEGMFALAILEDSKILLARDRFGIKPLYYAVFNNKLIFSSEIKPILKAQKTAPKLCTQAFADSIVLGHATGELTFFDGVKLLTPGSTMLVECKDMLKVDKPEIYYNRKVKRSDAIDIDSAEDELLGLLSASIKSHLIADVNVGISLSGGLDSTIITLLARDLNCGPLLTFTIADHAQHPDFLQANSISKIVNSQHYSFVVSFDEYLAAIPGFIASEEAPSSLRGLPFNLLCKKISKYVKVCLVGEGADELFGGYSDYLNLNHRLLSFQQRLPLLKRLGVLPSQVAIDIIEGLVNAGSYAERLDKVFTLNLGDQLERFHLNIVDKSSMATGLEMRVPYLDKSIYEFSASLPLESLVRRDLGIQKYILRRAALKRYGSNVFDVVLRRKMGGPTAGTLHLSKFTQMCEKMLPNDYLQRHQLGFCFATKHDLFMYELFEEIFFNNYGDYSKIGSVKDFLHAKSTSYA